MVDFVDSNFFQTIVTLLVGVIAYFLYWRQKRDNKQAAANSILLEIQHAERSITKVKEAVRRGGLEVEFEVLQADSWTKYKHLFSKDFDKDEWDAVTEFYIKAHLLDEAIKYNNKGFSDDVNQIRANKQRVLADFAKDLVDELVKVGDDDSRATEVQKFTTKIEVFDQMYMDKQGQYAYNPSKPVNDAKKYIEDLSSLSTSTVGSKLKKLAGVK